MYEKLVNALRCYAKDEECYHCEYFSEAGCDIDRMLFDAADAIEELSREVKSLEKILGTHPDPKGEPGEPGVLIQPKEKT